MISGIEHVAICARDSKALADWYVKTFDFVLIFENGAGAYFIQTKDGSVLEIMRFSSGVQPKDTSAIGLRHIAFSVSKEDFDIEVERVRKMNLPIEAEVSESSDGIKTFFFRDPEGNLLHFIYRPVAF